MRTFLIGLMISGSALAVLAQAQAPTFTAAGVLNGASMVSGSIAPGMVAAIQGTNLGDASFPGDCQHSTPTPATCTAVNVFVNGAVAPKLYDSATVLTFQVPFNLTGTTATIQVTSTLSGSQLSSSQVTLPVAPTAPGLFTLNGTGTGTAYYLDSGGLFPRISQAVQAGDTVILYGTGFGATNPAVATGAFPPTTIAAAAAAVTLTVNSQSVPVTAAGLEPANVSNANIGYDEVVFTVPSGLPVPATATQASFPVVVTVGGVASPPVNLLVAAAPPSITSVSPNPVPLSSNPQTVTFNGSGFQTGLTLTLYNPSNVATTIPASAITVVSGSQFQAQLTIGTTAGTFGVVVNNPNGAQSTNFLFSASGTAPAGPTITSIVTTSSNAPQIAQNTWIEVHGTQLATVASLTWSNSDFTKGLPTTLGNVSATVDGKPAAIFYVSPTQVNLLAPLDSALGTVQVVVTTASGQTVSQTVNESAISPALLVDVTNSGNYVAAQHGPPAYALLGPASLSVPGYTFTPATPGESVILYATGFGQTSPAFSGQLTVAGEGPFGATYELPLPWPTITVGNLPAAVSFAALVAPGLYQFNVTVPTSAPNGDLPVVVTYGGVSTQSNALITVLKQ